jgi:2-polyprenyl-3-methyl-5-hydroxy-6-metoxy-1,4-benzoquinol methylase
VERPSVSEQTLKYPGKELDLFARATNWKDYWSKVLSPYIGGDVLEVGAGLGVNTARIRTASVRSIHCLEPDEVLAKRMRAELTAWTDITVSVGTIETLSQHRFDTILYIDVLEHILDDELELANAAQLLTPSGRLIVLSPAHQFLFSPFDSAVGHYRRYNKKTLMERSPPSCDLVDIRYLDSVGLLASGANYALLKQSQPAQRQILFWDRILIPISRLLDPVLRYKLGKTIIAVWVRATGSTSQPKRSEFSPPLAAGDQGTFKIL